MTEFDPTVVTINPDLAVSVTDESAIEGDSVMRSDGTLVIYSPSADAVTEAAAEDVVRIAM